MIFTPVAPMGATGICPGRLWEGLPAFQASNRSSNLRRGTTVCLCLCSGLVTTRIAKLRPLA